MRTLPETFALLLSTLRDLISPVAAKDWSRSAFLVFVINRLRRLDRRFQRLYARWKNGTLPKPRTTPRAPRPAAPRPTHIKANGLPIFPLPTKNTWLIAQLPEARPSHSQLRHFVNNTPELLEFLAAAPQAGRLLRPLCRMLGVPLPPALARPKPARKPKPPEPPQPEPEGYPSPERRRLRAQNMFGYKNKSPEPAPSLRKRFSSA
jgi:hypothetical protein